MTGLHVVPACDIQQWICAMPYSLDHNNLWTHLAAPGQEVTITWSFADSNAVDHALQPGGTGQVRSDGLTRTLGDYPDFSNTLADPGQRDVIRSAFSEWDAHSGIRFVEVQDNVNANIRVGIYGTGGGLVTQSETRYGDIGVWQGNDFRTVALELNPNAFVSTDQLRWTALHEIGHAIGLGDTSGLIVSTAADVMNPNARTLVTHLSADDIRGAQDLYGGQPPAPDYVQQVARLYEAGLDRSFDAPGLNNWIHAREAGMTPTAMAAQFLDSAEFTQRYGDAHTMSDAAFITRLYANVLDRAPDTAGAAGWADRMSHGLTRADVLVGFSESPENHLHSAYLDHLVQVRPGYWDLA